MIEGDPEPLGWDLAFRRFTVLANGGPGLSGQGGIRDLGERSLDSVTSVPEDGCQRRSKRSQLWRLKMFHPAGGDEPQIVAASRRLRVRLG